MSRSARRKLLWPLSGVNLNQSEGISRRTVWAELGSQSKIKGGPHTGRRYSRVIRGALELTEAEVHDKIVTLEEAAKMVLDGADMFWGGFGYFVL